MADKYLNSTGLAYYHNRIVSLFATQTALNALDDRVDEIVAEGGEPNAIETVKVNGAALTPDANKAVDVITPTFTGTGTTAEIGYLGNYLRFAGGNDTLTFSAVAGEVQLSNVELATTDYVDANGGAIDTISIDGVAQTITNKAVNLPIGSMIADAIADVTQFDYEIVDTLPATGVKGTIYLIADATATGSNVYDEYVYVGNSFELIGKTGEIDLSGYWSTTDLVALTTAEIDAIIDGE